MKKYLSSVISKTIFSLLIFYFYCEYLIRNEIEPNDVLFDGLKYIQNSDSEWVALGDSRPSINLASCNFISNWSFPSENLNTIIEKANFLIKNKKETRNVLLQADPHMFCSKLVNFNSNHHELFASMDHNFELTAKCFTSYHNGKLLKYIAAKIKNSSIESRHKFSCNGSLIEKKQKIWGTLTPKERMSKARNRFFIDQVPLLNWKETTFYESYLSLIDSLNSSGVTVILVSYPITKEYFDLTKNHSVVNQIKYFYKKLSQNNDYVFYFDLSNSITESNLFHDQDHLNLLGTKKFRQILGKKLTAINLI